MATRLSAGVTGVAPASGAALVNESRGVVDLSRSAFGVVNPFNGRVFEARSGVEKAGDPFGAGLSSSMAPGKLLLLFWTDSGVVVD